MAHPQHEAVGAKQKRPQQQRAFLAAPQRRELVRGIERNVAMGANVLDREVVGERRPDQGKRRAAQDEEAGDPGAAGGLAEAVPGGFGTARAAPSAGGRAPESQAA